MNWTRALAAVGLSLSTISSVTMAGKTKQDIFMIMADEEGYYSIGAYSHGIHMPNGEVAAVLNYVRSSWGNTAPSASVRQVAAFSKGFLPGKVPQ